MWKKIGTIGPANNDNKSSRSRDENPYQPFSQMSKLRTNQSQIFFQTNQYFCPNYLSKKKSPQSKCFSQSRIKTVNQLNNTKSYNYIGSENSKINTIKKKTLKHEQLQELKSKMSQHLLDHLNDSDEKQNDFLYEQNLVGTQYTQKGASQTSLDSELKKLKQCKSTPHISFQKISSIVEQDKFLNKKLQTHNKLNSLKKQHSQIKKSVTKQLVAFKNSFNQLQVQLKNKLNEASQRQKYEKQMKQKLQTSQQSDLKQFMNETQKFKNKFQQLNQKKAQLMNKYKLLRAK